VVTVGRVPAWYSATRRDERAIVLPRELDDPADAPVRQLAYAALRVLGVRSSVTSMHWSRAADGTPHIVDITTRPPDPLMLSLMGHAHDIDMHRVWANVVVGGAFSPIPRSYAAGAVLLRTGATATDGFVGLRGVDAIKRELGTMLVEMRLPDRAAGSVTSRSDEAYVIVRHPETAVVEAALGHVAALVSAELD
jgi:hypothetical protein